MRYVNFKVKHSIHNRDFTIPVLGGLGYGNLFLKESWITEIVKNTYDENSTFIDVGSNLGQTFLQVKSIDKQLKYVGFDPNPNCTYYTKELASLNNMHDDQFFTCALNQKNEVLTFLYDSITDPRASTNSQLRPNYFSKSKKVIGIQFDDFFEFQKVNWIKIDVEGSEFSVLKGMRNVLQTHKPIVFCEVLDSHSDDTLRYTQELSDKLMLFLNEISYHVYQIEQANNGSLIRSYKRLNQFTIQQWTQKSLILNDYLCIPSEKATEFEYMLTKMTNEK